MKQATDVRGFTLIEMVLVVAVIAVISAITVPAVLNTTRQIRLSSSAREVERELQVARMKAVKSNRAIRLHFNCPGAGQYRITELLGTTEVPAPDDDESRAATRCSYGAYPYPDTNTDFFAIPNNDGPIQTLQDGIGFGSDVQTVEFWPDGTAHVASGGILPWPSIADTGINLTVFDIAHQSTITTSIEVNGLGKIKIQ